MKYLSTPTLQLILKLRENTVEGMRYSIENPLVLLRRHGVIELSNGYKINFDEKNKTMIIRLLILILSSGIRFGEGELQWKFDQKNGIVETHQGIKFSIEKVGLLDETFLFESHFSGFDLRDKVVVTAGAYIGDTPLYYAYYGAKVYAFEPDPYSFRIARRNISLNPNLENKIVLANYAIGRDGTVDFPLDEDSAGSSKFNTERMETVKIRSVSISTILNEYKIESPYLLDLDIKGAEFEINEDRSISKFTKVRLEYSPYLLDDKREVSELLNMLKIFGFNKTRIYKHYPLRFDLINHGTIYAEK